MTCDGGSAIGEGVTYIWYKDKRHVHNGKSYTIQSAETSHSGNYQCQTRPGEISDPARLDVSDGRVILQTPLHVYEGDEITIRCHHNPGYAGGWTIFYKDDSIIRQWANNAEYYIGNVDRMTAGTYGCRKQVQYVSQFFQDHIFVSVQELFTTPTITVTPQPVYKKDNMTLKCETSLLPSRQDTQLRFTFYREGWIVQGLSISDIYEVYNVQLEDSGKYSCEVETTDGRVRKRSAEQSLQIEDLFSHPNIIVTDYLIVEGDPMTLTCNTTLSPHINSSDVQFIFYRDERKVQEFNMSNKYEVQSVHLEDSGNYTCKVKTSTNNTMRRSSGLYILIAELFSSPVLKVSPELVNEGDNMTLTCETNLTKHRPDTILHYTFNRDRGTIQAFSSSHKYEVQFMRMDNSGRYTCEIQTSTGSVKKRSQELLIQIQDEHFITTILYASLGLLLLIVIVMIFLYIYYQRRSANKNHPTTVADKEPSPTAELSYAVLTMTSRPQNNLQKDNESSIVYATVKSKTYRQVEEPQVTSDMSTDIYQNISSHR
ncbi:Fc receptor-like [Pristimantis euphronides]